jgi:hypothetical protein
VHSTMMSSKNVNNNLRDNADNQSEAKKKKPVNVTWETIPTPLMKCPWTFGPSCQSFSSTMLGLGGRLRVA